jgi:hypothetical protein
VLDIAPQGSDVHSIVKQAADQTRCRFPDLFWIAKLAQAATTRILYRGTNIERSDQTEIMTMELGALVSAKEGGILEKEFYAWHKTMFADEIVPAEVLVRLEEIVVKRLGEGRLERQRLSDAVDITIPIVPSVIRVDLKKFLRAVTTLVRETKARLRARRARK